MVKYNSRKSIMTTSILILMCGLCALVLYRAFKSDGFGWNTDTLVPIVIIGLTTTLLISMFFYTRYSISDKYLSYVTGPFRGKILIESINKIEKNTTTYGGMKPALATNGLIVIYNKFDEIYISPDSNDLFVDQLLKINPNIEVIDMRLN